MSERMSYQRRRMPMRYACALLLSFSAATDQWVTDGAVREAVAEFASDKLNEQQSQQAVKSRDYTQIALENRSTQWTANPNGEAVIDNLSIPSHQKEYVKFVFNGVKYAMNNGSQVNPQLMMAVPIIETGYGTDTLSNESNNHHGIKGATAECGSVTSPTREEINGEDIFIEDEFKCYTDKFGSFVDFSGLMGRKPHFSEVVPCSGSLEDAANALQHEVDPVTCDIIAYQQSISPITGKKVLGHATDSSYVAVVQDVAQFIHVDELFYPA